MAISYKIKILCILEPDRLAVTTASFASGVMDCLFHVSDSQSPPLKTGVITLQGLLRGLNVAMNVKVMDTHTGTWEFLNKY